MNWIDYLIVFIPLAFIFFMAYYTRRYIHGVSDFLVAGRVCGRYVLSVAQDTAGAMGLVVVLAYVEIHYKTGFALAFWNNLRLPIASLLALTGFCIYRYRETKSMSFGQFLEMRYNRSLRILAGVLRSISEVLASVICPALAARFFIYIFDIPNKISIGGFEISTFMLLVGIVVFMALLIIFLGGNIAIIVTDTIQGLICFPLLVFFTIFILTKFSWNSEIVPVMLDRIPGESFLNPYDVSGLRDFNIFAFLVTCFATIVHSASWIGGGASGAGRTPHEQKMAGVLGPFRGGAYAIFCILLAAMLLTFLNHKNFSAGSKKVRDTISVRVADEIFQNSEMKKQIVFKTTNIPMHTHRIGFDKPLSEKANLDTPYIEAVAQIVNENNEPKGKIQEFRTLFHQLMLPVTLRHVLPHGLLGAFALLMLVMMLSTDDSRIFGSASTITQDVIMPLLKRNLSPEKHIKIIKITALAIGVVFFICSNFMAQLDYINLFVTIVCSVWMGGCAPVMLFGLYSRFGNTIGAFSALIFGMFSSLFGIFIQRNWADLVYPWLTTHELVPIVSRILSTLSAPFNPYIVWEMNAIKCPINSIEFYAATMLSSFVVYIAASFLFYKGPFNMDRMLHRGIYETGEPKPAKTQWTFHNVFGKLIGITSEYTKGDRIIAKSVFFYQFILKFVVLFVCVVLWNTASPFSKQQWGNYFLLQSLLIPGAIAFISTFWFGIGGIVDLRKMFIALKKRVDNPLDNGQVEGEVSLADKAQFSKVKHNVEESK